jgi:hypothetical protein
MTSTPSSPKLAEGLEAIRALCVGRAEWRVARDDGAYCMSFSREDSHNPEQEANEWLARHLCDYPERFMGYKVQRVVVQSQLQEEALALIVRLSDAQASIQALEAEVAGLRAKLNGAVIAAYTLPAPDGSKLDEIRIERARQMDGGALWAVRFRGDVLNKQGVWEWEPMPSGRDDDFLARARFDSATAAIDAARAAQEVKP